MLLLSAFATSIFIWAWMRERGLRKEAEIKFHFAEQCVQKIPFLEASLKEKEKECSAFHTAQRVAEEILRNLRDAEEQM